MYTVKPTVKFKKDLKLIEKRGYKIDLLTEVIKKLATGEKKENCNERLQTKRT
jgi:mRNA interferase YafQ